METISLAILRAITAPQYARYKLERRCYDVRCTMYEQLRAIFTWNGQPAPVCPTVRSRAAQYISNKPTNTKVKLPDRSARGSRRRTKFNPPGPCLRKDTDGANERDFHARNEHQRSCVQ